MMMTVWRKQWPWPAPVALVAVGPREPQYEALAQHVLARPVDALARLILFFPWADGDDAGGGP